MLAFIGVSAAFVVPPLIGMWRHSLWLDETITLFPLPTGHQSLAELAANLRSAVGSLAHTPLHTLMSAAWASLCPASEFCLRLANLPVILFFTWLGWIWTRFFEPTSVSHRWGILVLFASSPFFIYYAYDFRPYLLLILTSAMMSVGLLFLDESPRRALWLLCCGATLAFATQPTMALVIPWLVAIVLWSRRQALPELLRPSILPALVCMIPAAVVGWHYLALWKSGGMASFGAAPTVKNLLFVFYEFFGFLGIGPTREQLRSLAPPPGREPTILIDVRPTTGDWLEAAAWSLVWLIVLAFAVRDFLIRRPLSRSREVGLWRVLLFGLGGMLILMAFFRLKEYRFLARHVSFLYVPICWPIFTIIVSATAGRARNWLFVAGLLALHVWSSSHLLFSPAYGRDDLRGALTAANAKLEAKEASAVFMFGGWQPPMFYSPAKELGQIEGERVTAGTRTGTGRHVFRAAASLRELYQRGVSWWCVGDQAPGREQELLDLYAGQTVAVVTLRGTEGDSKGLIRRLINVSTLKPTSLGRFPFVEVFLVAIPARQDAVP